MSKKLFFYLTLFMVFLTSFICAAAQNTRQKDLTKEITAEVVNAGYRLNEKTHSVIFDCDTQLTNNSGEGIMQIKYRLTFLDRSGEEIDSVIPVFNGQDTPLSPGESITHNRSGQFKSDIKPDSVKAEILEVLTEEEMPPIHVPQPGEYVYQAFNNANLNNILEEPPVAVKMWIDRGGERDEGLLTDPEDIAVFVDAFTKIKIASDNGTFVTDNYNGVSMEFANGEYYWISLLLHDLEYEIYGEWYIYEMMDAEPFWTIMYLVTHPVYNGEERGGS